MPRSGARVTRRNAHVRSSFNEAGAIMPRSGWDTGARWEASATRFNEAGAIMPRSGRRQPLPADQRLDASMRPGQSCPGVAPWPGRSRRALRLSFNEAGAIMPRSGDLPTISSAGLPTLQ